MNDKAFLQFLSTEKTLIFYITEIRCPSNDAENLAKKPNAISMNNTNCIETTPGSSKRAELEQHFCCSAASFAHTLTGYNADADNNMNVAGTDK
ncbi:hypothetical protein BLA29_009681 [Euroglyphus maynei]|uniref:Uncharacterized protein n=1 Tax=Euroglyphus maynei TaxID=6958 RepID=A0A1Y3APW4_EURMA|nr:hypothetical protein BLA29_009681 [Euroglyphus maynei]